MSSMRGFTRAGVVMAAACLAVTMGGLVPASAAEATSGGHGSNLAKNLANKVDINAVNRHLVAFQRISDRNGGRRAPGTPGHEASADYVIGKLNAAGFDVTTQQFPIRYSEALTERLIVDGKRYQMHMMLFTKDSPVGGVTGQLAVLPDDPTSGCEASDFAGADYTGKIVLMKRGGCPFAPKQANAAAAGAIAAVVYNNADTWLRGNVGSEAASRIPTGGVSKRDGEALLSQHGAPATLEIRSLVEMRTSRTVLAQTKTGRKDNVVMSGAHLDSVVEGPGMNGNGSGSAALLETALQLGGSPRVSNAVRFAFWGSWEFGIIGSPYYVQHLSFEEQLDIALYLNFDTLASPNGAYFVYDGDNSGGGGAGPYGSAQIEKSFVDYLGSIKVQTEGYPLSFRSDHVPFVAAGIPSGGLYTGQQEVKTAAQAAKWGGTAGAPLDVCYHEACDNLGNINRGALAKNSKAVAYVTATYAHSTEDVNGVPPRAHRAAARAASAKAAKASVLEDAQNASTS